MSSKTVSDNGKKVEPSNAQAVEQVEVEVEVFEFSDEQLAAGYAALHQLKTVLGPLLASGNPAILKQLQPRLRRLRRLQKKVAEVMASMRPANDSPKTPELKARAFSPEDKTRH